MFTFPWATIQARALTFEGTFELHKNLVERNKIGFETFDKTKKKDFTVNKPDEDKDHALESAREGEKRTVLREDINLWRRSISESVRLDENLNSKPMERNCQGHLKQWGFSQKQLYKDQQIASTKIGYPTKDLPKNEFSPHCPPLGEQKGKIPGKLEQ